jgi:hypothetical protein
VSQNPSHPLDPYSILNGKREHGLNRCCGSERIEAVSIIDEGLTVDGHAANIVRINFK